VSHLAAWQVATVLGPRVSTMRGQARGEMFRIVQLEGQLFVGTKQNGSCCCGWSEKGRLPFEPQPLWGDEWKRRRIRNRLHLTFASCLGPCAVGNNALLQLHGRAIWPHELDDPALVPLVFKYAEAILDTGGILPVPDELRGHVYERFLAPPDTDWAPLPDQQQSDTLDGLEPVCLMDVDPATARYTVEYAGRTVVFCAPACKKQFVADPSAYLSA
jgi:YHS domain-containing protein